MQNNIDNRKDQTDILNTSPDLDAWTEFFRRITDMHQIAVEFNEYLKFNTYPKETSDILEIVTLYKQGFGRNWVPSRFKRPYMRIAVVVPTIIQVTSFLGPPLTLTIPPITPPAFWTVWDWPDQSSFMLDNTASANQMNVYVRFTDVV